MSEDDAAKLKFETPLHEKLYWAKHHGSDYTIAEHNRKWYASEAVRLQAEVDAAAEAAAFDARMDAKHKAWIAAK